MKKIKVLVLALLCAVFTPSKADEGMWLLQLMKEQNLAEANAMLEAWTQGLDVAENEELKLKAVKAYIAQVEEEIAGLQLKLDEEQKLFDQYTAEKDALMNVLIGKPYEE